MSPRRGTELTSHSHPKLRLLTICVASSTYPNSRGKKKNSLYFWQTELSSSLVQALLTFCTRGYKKQNPQQNYSSNMSPAEVSPLCSLPRCLGVGLAPARGGSGVPGPSTRHSARSSYAGRGQLPLPPALLFSPHNLTWMRGDISHTQPNNHGYLPQDRTSWNDTNAAEAAPTIKASDLQLSGVAGTGVLRGGGGSNSPSSAQELKDKLLDKVVLSFGKPLKGQYTLQGTNSLPSSNLASVPPNRRAVAGGGLPNARGRQGTHPWGRPELSRAVAEPAFSF